MCKMDEPSPIAKAVAICRRHDLGELVAFWQAADAHATRGFRIAVAGRHRTGRTSLAHALGELLGHEILDGPPLPDAGLGDGPPLLHPLRWADALVVVSPCFAFGGAAEFGILAWALRHRVPAFLAATFPERRQGTPEFASELERYEVRPFQDEHGTFRWAICGSPETSLPEQLVDVARSWIADAASLHAKTLGRALRAVHEVGARAWAERTASYREAQNLVTRAHGQCATETARLDDAIGSRLSHLEDAPRAAFDELLEDFHRLVVSLELREIDAGQLETLVAEEGELLDARFRRRIAESHQAASVQYLELLREVALDASSLWGETDEELAWTSVETAPQSPELRELFTSAILPELTTAVAVVCAAREDPKESQSELGKRARQAARRVVGATLEVEAARVLAVVRDIYQRQVEHWTEEARASTEAFLRTSRAAFLVWLEAGAARFRDRVLAPYTTFDADAEEYARAVRDLERSAARR